MMRLPTILCLALVLCGLRSGAQEPPIALTGATVYSAAGRPIPRATILIAGGKIAAVGPGVTVPPNARRIDLHGATVIPGLVDARSSLFLSDADVAGNGAADQNVLDAADMYRDEAAKVLAQGVTTLYLSPGSRGSVAGVGAVVKLRVPDSAAGDRWARVLLPGAALDLSLSTSANGRSTSLERLNAYEALRTLFRGAQQYAKSLEKYERDLKDFQSQPPAPKPAPGAQAATTTPPQRPTKPRANPAQETVLAALKGSLLVRIESNRPDEILNAMRLVDEFHLRAVLQYGAESAAFATEIARHRIPVVWGPTLAGQPRLETRFHRPETAAILARAGVAIALTPASRSGLASRFLRENAALAVSYGLAPDRALRAITIDAAKALGVADRVGSIEAGKDADLVVLSAPPFDPSARVQRLFIDGAEVAIPRSQVTRAGAKTKQAATAHGRRTSG